jgi:hypothetical protein
VLRSHRLVLLIGGFALIAAAPVAAKENVKATLITPIRVDAPAGERLRVAWRLAYSDERGDERPFGAGGVYVRLVSASGAANVGNARGDRGVYSARVVVPEGGIADVEIGLMGWRSGAGGTRRADMIFPITNDPLPGPARISIGSGESEWLPWLLVLVAGSFAAAALVMRRRTLAAT